MPSGVPDPVQAPDGQPAQDTQCPPLHWPSAVHQQATPEPAHAPPGVVIVSHAPTEQDQTVAAEMRDWQFALSTAPLPVHAPVHWLFRLTHLPLEQSPSATQRHTECVESHTGSGDRVVGHP
jgi:hypothetical protein